MRKVIKEKCKEFLEYNKDNIFKNLLQAEHHAKVLTDPSHAQCITKHLAFIEGEAEEAYSHAQIVEPENAEIYMDFRNLVHALRKRVMKGNISKDELSKSLWALRKAFEEFNKEYSTLECGACEAISLIVEDEVSVRDVEKLEKSI